MVCSRRMVCAVVLVLLATGCSSVPQPSLASSEAQPDMRAVVAVVEDVYAQLERPASVFLGADAIEDTAMARVRTTLGSSLATTFHPPSERASGNPGASIALGRFSIVEDGRLSVVASFLQEDGGGRGCTEYALEGEDWVIVEAVDAWPDCPISDQGADTYHAALERARSDECFGKWTSIGTCGPWLYVSETSGYGGTRSYFDPQTGLIVAQGSFTDVGPVFDRFVFGHVECTPTITETIACYRAEEEECEAAGGVWQVWGISEHPSCNLRTSDAGVPCTDSRECQGECVADLFPDALCDGVVAGQCSEFRTPFGCFCFMHEGLANAICVD